MEQKPKPQKTSADARSDRLKAALKANLGRRKAQAKARTGAGDTGKAPKEADKG